MGELNALKLMNRKAGMKRIHTTRINSRPIAPPCRPRYAASGDGEGGSDTEEANDASGDGPENDRVYDRARFNGSDGVYDAEGAKAFWR